MYEVLYKHAHTAPGAGREKKATLSLDSSTGRPRSDPQKTRDFSIHGVYRKQIEPENDRFCGVVAGACMTDGMRVWVRMNVWVNVWL